MKSRVNPLIVSLKSVPTQAWRNGAGLTQEMLTGPVDDGGLWSYRISVAQIASDGPFSRFDSTQRHFCVLSGQGVNMSIDGQQHVVLKDSPALSFSGEANIECQLIDGVTSDLNLMVRAAPQVRTHSGLLRLSSNERLRVPFDKSDERPHERSAGLFALFDGACEWQFGHQTFFRPLQSNDLIWFAQAPESIAMIVARPDKSAGPVAWGMFVDQEARCEA